MNFFWETIILFGVTLVFYLSSFGLFYYWRETQENYIYPPLIFTFEFFVSAFIIIFWGSALIQYMPTIISLFQ